ncbi:MAG: thioredoxin family protein [Paenibacillaceae bacterium]
MNTVIDEILTCKNDLAYQIVYVDVDHETTNRYRVKTNPTTLFLDNNDRELYRIEGFMETTEVWSLFTQIEEGSLRSEEPWEENRGTIETYTFYLYHNGHVVPVKEEVKNLTSVAAPRITAIQQLLSSRPDGFDNPFPRGTSLEQVTFNDKYGVIRLHTPHEVDKQETEQMKALLLRTLAAYGITDIILEWMSDTDKLNEKILQG